MVYLHTKFKSYKCLISSKVTNQIHFHRPVPQFHLHYQNLHKMKLWLELEKFSEELLLLDISNHNILILAKIV